MAICRICWTSLADFGAFRANSRGGRCLGARGAVIPTAGNVLGGGHYDGDYAIVPGCCAYCFRAAIRWDGAWSVGRCDCSKLLRVANICIRCKRVLPGAALRTGALGSKRVSVRGCNPDNCVVGAADSSRMAGRLSSVRRSVHRNRGCAHLDGGVAGERNHTVDKNVNGKLRNEFRYQHLGRELSFCVACRARDPRQNRRRCWFRCKPFASIRRPQSPTRNVPSVSMDSTQQLCVNSPS